MYQNTNIKHNSNNVYQYHLSGQKNWSLISSVFVSFSITMVSSTGNPVVSSAPHVTLISHTFHSTIRTVLCWLEHIPTTLPRWTFLTCRMTSPPTGSSQMANGKYFTQKRVSVVYCIPQHTPKFHVVHYCSHLYGIIWRLNINRCKHHFPLVNSWFSA